MSIHNLVAVNVFDLLIARLNKYDIKLRELWEESRQHSKIAEYADYEIMKGAYKIPIYILQSIALCFSNSRSCKGRDILNIYSNTSSNKQEFEEKWKLMTRYTVEAIKLLENTKDGYGVIGPKELPFEPMIPVVASLLRK